MTTFLSQVAQITPSLYLSGFVGASEANLRKYRITYIITVCKEIPKINVSNVDSLKLDVLDRPNEQLDRYFDFVADKINEIELRNGICLVHCVAGVSRSATMCIVYLMKYHKLSLRDAYNFVKSKRTFIRPNLGFWSQLVDYERKLFGKNSVRMIQCNFGFIPDVYENEFRNMIVPTPYNNIPINTNGNYTVAKLVTPTSNSVSTASITLTNNQIKLPTQQTTTTAAASTKPLTSLAFTAQLRNNLTGSTTSNYATTYNSSYGLKR